MGSPITYNVNDKVWIVPRVRARRMPGTVTVNNGDNTYSVAVATRTYTNVVWTKLEHRSS